MFQLEIMNQNSDLDFDAFKRLALDSSLSRHEKNGFPDAYRDGKEEFIFRDICLKATNLNRSRITVLDIGPGCSHLPVMMAELCNQKRSHLMFVDSAEMLSHLPKGERITHYGGRFPAALAAPAGASGHWRAHLRYRLLPAQDLRKILRSCVPK